MIRNEKPDGEKYIYIKYTLIYPSKSWKLPESSAQIKWQYCNIFIYTYYNVQSLWIVVIMAAWGWKRRPDASRTESPSDPRPLSRGFPGRLFIRFIRGKNRQGKSPGPSVLTKLNTFLKNKSRGGVRPDPAPPTWAEASWHDVQVWCGFTVVFWRRS